MQTGHSCSFAQSDLEAIRAKLAADVALYRSRIKQLADDLLYRLSNSTVSKALTRGKSLAITFIGVQTAILLFGACMLIFRMPHAGQLA